jgi:ABC-type uncharacterized transport system substrate-binding protein
VSLCLYNGFVDHLNADDHNEGIAVMRFRFVCFLVLLGMIFCSQPSMASEKDQFSTTPRTKNGEKWRVGYYEGGHDANYYNYLSAMIRGLMDLGWIERSQIPEPKGKETRPVWDWMAKELKSQYIEFVPDAYFTANWDQAGRTELRGTVIKRLNENKDLDIIVAMGTWAGQDLANNEHSTPIMIMSASDPVKSEIIKSTEDSGFDHVHARVDPLRFERQIRIFHDMIGFKRLGVAYEDSLYGRAYAAIDLVEKVAKERGFEVVNCFTQSDIADQNLAGESVASCFKELVAKVDAIYVNQQGGVNNKTIPELVRIANEHRIPTFSQTGAEWVKYGFLMSISRVGFKPVGMFEAAIMAKIFNGAKARQLPQLFQESPNIALNLKTAEVIGLYLHADVLAAADEIYNEISAPE